MVLQSFNTDTTLKRVARQVDRPFRNDAEGEASTPHQWIRTLWATALVKVEEQ